MCEEFGRGSPRNVCTSAQLNRPLRILAPLSYTRAVQDPRTVLVETVTDFHSTAMHPCIKNSVASCLFSRIGLHY